MPDIFVSYARADHLRVAPIVRILESLGWSVWWDARLASGNEFDQEISHQLAAAKCVLVIWTQASVQSRWVRGEAREGLERSVTIPVMLENVAVPIDFRAVQFTNLSNWRGDPGAQEILELRDAISVVLSTPPHPEGPAALKQQRARSRAISLRVGLLGLALVLVLTAAVERRAIVYGIHALHSEAPFSEPFTQAFNHYRASLQTTIKNQLSDELNRKPPDTWGFSQVLLASEVTPDREREAFEFYRKAYNEKCACWTTFDNEQQVVASAWVLLAYARSGHPVPDRVIPKFLATQSNQGWWPAFFDADIGDASASSYATALVVLALHEYRLKTAAGSGDERAKIDDSIARAGSWLYNSRPSRGHLWADYPNVQGDMTPSRGVSAIITSVFLTVFKDQPVSKDQPAYDLFKDWFAGLHTPVTFAELEQAKTQTKRQTTGFWHQDSTRYLIVPWEIVALSEGYTWLDRRERIAAQEYLFDAQSLIDADHGVPHHDFILGEALFALRYAATAAGIESERAKPSPPQ